MAIDREKVQQAAQKLVEKKKYKEAVLEYQKITAADPNDARTLLKIGDLQSKLASHAEAVATYESVAKLYANQGFALKAIAVYKQIREIIAKYAPNLEERYSHVGPKLAELYQQLGLISDALAAQVGGIGIAPGANLSDSIAMFEATHGTAPKYAGKDYVNPGSQILSSEMMLRHMGWTAAADLILSSMEKSIASKQVTYDFARLMEGATQVSCSGFGDVMIANM